MFVISWVNPDERLRHKDFEDYMREGPLAALDAIEQGDRRDQGPRHRLLRRRHAVVVDLATMAAKNDDRVASATLFAAQVDFTHAGDLKVFVDEDQLEVLEKRMAERGYLEGKKMANAFNMLRSNDLIWPYIINNYLRGKAPMPFDLLYWNSDATRMPAANHAFYLRQCYLNNTLSQGKMTPAMWPEPASTNFTGPPNNLRAEEHRFRRRDVVLARREIVDRHFDLAEIELDVGDRHLALGQRVLEIAIAQIERVVGRRHARRIGIPVQQVERAAAPCPADSC